MARRRLPASPRRARMNEPRRPAAFVPDRAGAPAPVGLDGAGRCVEHAAGPPAHAGPCVSRRLRRAAAMGLAGGLTGLAIGAALYQFGPELETAAPPAS